MTAVLSGKERDHLARHEAGVLAVATADGRLHQSVVRYVLDGDDICISTEATRTKARYIASGGEARFTVMAAEPPYAAVTVVAHGSIERSGIAAITGRVMAQMGVTDEVTDEVLAAVGRVVVRIRPERVLSAWL